MGRATGFFKRTGSGTSAQTSGCDCRMSGTRSTVAALGLPPRSASLFSIRDCGSASRAMRRQVGHSPQKSSVRRSQLAACANMRARVNLPTPRGPVKSSACGTRWARRAPRSAATICWLPRNSERAMSLSAALSRIAGYWRRQQKLNGGQHFASNFLHGAQGSASGIEAFDGHPRCAAGQLIVHSGGLLQMPQAGLLQVLLGVGVAAFCLLCDEFLGLGRGHAKIEDEILAGQFVNVVFEMLNPAPKRVALVRRGTGGLMREIGTDVAVDEYDFAFVEGGFDFGLGFEAITGVEQRGEMRVQGVELAELAIKKLADHFAEPGVVLRKCRGIDAMPTFAGGEDPVQEIHLRALAAAIDAFDGNEPAERSSIYIWTQTSLNSRDN